MNSVGEVVPIAMGIIRTLLKLTHEELFEEVQVPVRTATDRNVSISYTKKQRIRYGLGLRHEAKTHFRSAARQVAGILAQHHDLTPLVQGAGPVGETNEETAGIRFLGRLIDAAIGGAEKPSTTQVLKRICAIFEAQLATGEVRVDWIYPLPGIALTAPLQLSDSVRIQELDERRFELLYRYAEGGFVSHTILLQTTAALTVRATARMPFGHTGRENSEVLHNIVLAFVLSDLPPPAMLTSWVESKEPSAFELGHASWFAPWSASPLAFFRSVTLAPDRMKILKDVYKVVDSCPAEVLNSLPARRAISAAARNSYEDQLIDLWIALEALLLRDDETTELQYRMAFRAAWIVKPPVFRDFERIFKKGYQDRSKVVHGSRHTVKKESAQRSEWVFSILKQILLHSFRERRLPDLLRIEEEMMLGLRTSPRTPGRTQERRPARRPKLLKVPK